MRLLFKSLACNSSVINPAEGNVPVQSEGYIDGHPYYFRSRGDHWDFAISPPGGNPMRGLGLDAIYSRSGYVGPWPAAGWLPHSDADRIIRECADEFLQGRRGRVPCQCTDCTGGEWIER